MSYCAHCGAQIPTLAPPCPACGKPPSGSLPPPAPRAGSNVAVIVAVVAGVFFIGVFVIGILAAIAIPNLLTAIERSKQKRAMADIRNIATALEEYAKDNRQYPAGSSVGEIKGALVPAYRPALPEVDGWSWKLRYMCWQEDPSAAGCDHYRIASAGKDGILEHVDLREYEQGRTRDFNCDIVFGSGDFVQAPEGFTN